MIWLIGHPYNLEQGSMSGICLLSFLFCFSYIKRNFFLIPLEIWINKKLVPNYQTFLMRNQNKKYGHDVFGFVFRQSKNICIIHTIFTFQFIFVVPSANCKVAPDSTHITQIKKHMFKYSLFPKLNRTRTLMFWLEKLLTR